MSVIIALWKYDGFIFKNVLLKLEIEKNIIFDATKYSMLYIA